MACTVSEELTAYLDGELDRDARVRVEQHLADCPDCSGELALLRTLQPRLEAIPAIEPSAQLRRNVLNALPERRSGWSLWRYLVPAAGLAAAAAAVLVLHGKPAPEAPEQLELAQNLELVENLGALQTADLSDEDLEVVANLDQLERKE